MPCRAPSCASGVTRQSQSLACSETRYQIRHVVVVCRFGCERGVSGPRSVFSEVLGSQVTHAPGFVAQRQLPAAVGVEPSAQAATMELMCTDIPEALMAPAHNEQSEMQLRVAGVDAVP
jgi:hypothetical protein